MLEDILGAEGIVMRHKAVKRGRPVVSQPVKAVQETAIIDEVEPIKKTTKREQKDRQVVVADLWFKGYNKADIVNETGFTGQEVERSLVLIRYKLTPKTVRTIEYRRNKCLGKINLVQKIAWGIIATTTSDTIKLSALGRITSSHELESKVQGVAQEKLIVGPEKEANTLLKQILELDKKSADTPDGNGHKEPEKLPFLEN